MTRGALYHHFVDKRDLFRAVHEELEGELVAGIGARMEGVADPWELILAGLRAFLDACTDPAIMRVSLLDAPAVLGWDEWRGSRATTATAWSASPSRTPWTPACSRPDPSRRWPTC